MHLSSTSHFQRLPPEAQRAALWRLAWTGLAPEQIAERTGWTPEQVRRAIDEEVAPQPAPWTHWSSRIAAHA